MKHLLRPAFALLSFALLTSASVFAETQEKIIIALQTGDFELAETDISNLAIGEAKTIETDSGKIIDILRTNDGAEIFVDGELLEMNFGDEDLHAEHMMTKHVEVLCDGEDGCDENIVILDSEGNETSEWVMSDGNHVSISHDVEITCSDDEDGTHCDHQMVFISDDGDIDLDAIHEAHGSEDVNTRIVIKKVDVTKD